MNQVEKETLEKFEERIGSVEEKVNSVDIKLDLILSAIKGDAFGVNGGLLGKIKRIEENDIPSIKSRLLKLETLKNRVLWMAAGAGVAGGFSIKTIIEWIQESAQRH